MTHAGLRGGWQQSGRWRRFAVALGVWALLSQTVVILIHRPPSAAPADLTMAMAMGPDCPMMMGDQEGGAPQPAPADSGTAPMHKAPPVCPICQSLQANGLFVAPAQPVMPVALGVVVTVALLPASQPPATHTNEQARSRAPPVLALRLIATLDA